jgi:hypothetical protein
VISSKGTKVDLWWLAVVIPLAGIILGLIALAGFANWVMAQVSAGAFEPPELDTIDE